MEDALRSLGAVLDSVRASAVLIREAPWGLVLRARVAVALHDRPEGRWSPIEREMTAADVARYRQEAVARRGSGHVAGPHERSLRMVGRRIDDEHLAAVTLIQHPAEGSWLLWHGANPIDGPTLLVLEDDQLLVRDARERDRRVARERRDAVAIETGHILGR
ncbi:MAG: hypothetical protein U0667_08230 [Chloroflexota bacterium]